jgi:hypothetical protein
MLEEENPGAVILTASSTVSFSMSQKTTSLPDIALRIEGEVSTGLMRTCYCNSLCQALAFETKRSGRSTRAFQRLPWPTMPSHWLIR